MSGSSLLGIRVFGDMNVLKISSGGELGWASPLKRVERSPRYHIFIFGALLQYSLKILQKSFDS